MKPEQSAALIQYRLEQADESLPKSLSRSLHLAFERRQVYEYGELIRLDQEATAATIADAGQFVDAVRVHLAQGGPGAPG